MFDDSLLIVAHPDDEILWLGSVVDKVNGIIFCFEDDSNDPETGRKRRKAITAHPLASVSSLGLSEPQAWDQADWNQPATSDWGLKLVKDMESELLYQESYKKLREKLRTRVAAAKNIFTHNPWGEYGHEEHVLVYRVLQSLQQEFNYLLWYSNYCSNRSMILMNRYISGFDSAYERLPVNLDLVKRIAEIYKQNNCWTWYNDYEWFDFECLKREVPGHEHSEPLLYGHNFPLNYIKIHIGGTSQQSRQLFPGLSRLKRWLPSK